MKNMIENTVVSASKAIELKNVEISLQYEIEGVKSENIITVEVPANQYAVVQSVICKDKAKVFQAYIQSGNDLEKAKDMMVKLSGKFFELVIEKVQAQIPFLHLLENVKISDPNLLCRHRIEGTVCNKIWFDLDGVGTIVDENVDGLANGLYNKILGLKKGDEGYRA